MRAKYWLVAALVAAGCGSSNPTTTDAGGTDTGGGGSDGGGTCPTDLTCTMCGWSHVSSTCGGLCPSVVMNDPMHANIRMTQLDPSAPMVLSSAVIRSILNGGIVAGSFAWGFSFDFTANTLTSGGLDPNNVMAGSMGLADATFRYFSGNAPTTGGAMANRWDPITVGITMNADGTYSTMVVPHLTVPAYNAMPDMTGHFQLLTELPLSNVRILNMHVSMDHNCIGLTASNTFCGCVQNQWQTSSGATLDGNVTIADAEMVQIPAPLNRSLCDLLAGLSGPAGMQTCTTVPQSMWHNQPDAMTTAPNDSFHIVANFAGVSTHIANVPSH